MRKRIQAAFTLIELLVVIAIIAILAAMLLPALATAKDNAMKTTCISNLKQLGITQHMYTDDNHEVLPLCGWDGGANEGLDAHKNPYITWLYQPNATQGTINGCAVADPFLTPWKNQGESTYYNGLYEKYMTGGKAFLCPKDVAVSPTYLWTASGKTGMNARQNSLATYLMNGSVCSFSDSGYSPFSSQKVTSVWTPMCYIQWEPDEYENSNGTRNNTGNAFEWNDCSNSPDAPPNGVEGIGRLHNKSGGEILALDSHVQFITAQQFASEANKNGLGPGGKSYVWWGLANANGH